MVCTTSSLYYLLQVCLRLECIQNSARVPQCWIKIITSTKIISFRKIFSAERQYFGVVHYLMSASMDTNFWSFSKVSIIYNVYVQNIREIRGPVKQTNFIYKKIFVPIMSGQAGSPQIYLANQRSTNNEYINYTQSNSLIDNVPLSAHINNYLI